MSRSIALPFIVSAFSKCHLFLQWDGTAMNQWKTLRQQNTLGCCAQPTCILSSKNSLGITVSKILLCISATELHGTHPRIHKAVGPDIVTAEIFAYDSTGICRRLIWLHITCAVVFCWIDIVNIYDEST